MKGLLLNFGTTEITLCVIGVLFLVAIIVFLVVVPVKSYFLAINSGCYISAGKLVSMKKRNIDVKLVVETYIASKKAGLELSVNDFEVHQMSGGNIEKLLKALLLAKQSGINIDVENAKAIDKSGENVVKVVENAISPAVFPFTNVIGMSKDNIELIVSGKVTAKANLKNFIGGVQIETLIARVSNEIIEIINNSECYNIVLENPSLVTDVIKGKKLDNRSAYDILSVDITNIRIGENHNLHNIREDAEKRKMEISIETENRRKQAVIDEGEMKCKVQQAKIDLIKQEQDFSKALYDAVQNKDFDALDYFKIKNLQADTEMRNLIAHPELKENSDISDRLSSLFDDEEGDDI